MEQIKYKGNYGVCPYCEKLFGNGISIVYVNIVQGCLCPGMTEARKYKQLEEKLKKKD